MNNINFTLPNAKMITLMRTYLNTIVPIFILVVFSCFFSQSANAQDVKLGLSLTPNVSWMKSTDYDHVSMGSKLNFGFEFMADIMMNENYAFSTGVHIFQTGGRINYLVPNPTASQFLMTTDRDYSLKYVEVPLTFKMRTKEIGYSTIYGRFGLGLGLNIRANAKEARNNSWLQTNEPLPETDAVWAALGSGVETPSFDDIEVQNDIRLFRSSMIVGGGVERSLGGTSSLVIGVNYNVSFINTYKDLEQVKVDGDGIPVTQDGVLSMGPIKGNDNAIELVLGLIF